MQVQIFEEKYQEKWENAYLTFKNATASGALGALSGPQTPAYKLMCLQSKPKEQIKPFIFSY